jgi:hypothetical protein
MTDFRNMTVRTITMAEEVAKMNINILSSPNVYHSITLPSKKGNSAQTPALPAENTYGQHGGLSMAPALLTGSGWWNREASYTPHKEPTPCIGRQPLILS